MTNLADNKVISEEYLEQVRDELKDRLDRRMARQEELVRGRWRSVGRSAEEVEAEIDRNFGAIEEPTDHLKALGEKG